MLWVLSELEWEGFEAHWVRGAWASEKGIETLITLTLEG